MTLRIEWRHLRGEDDRKIEYVSRATADECMDYWSDAVLVYRRTLYPCTFTCVCSFEQGTTLTA